MAHEDDVLRLKVAYRDARVQAFRNPDSADAEQEAQRIAAELEQFYLASGQDMKDLNLFFASCDLDFANFVGM